MDDKKVGAVLPVREVKQLERLARKNDRSLAAEIRQAIRNHLQSNGSAASSPEKRSRAATRKEV